MARRAKNAVPALSEVDRQLSVERLMARVRTMAAIFYVFSSAVEPGDSVVATVLIGVSLACAAALATIATRAGHLAPRIGIGFMVFDCLLVTAVLSNNLTDPLDVIYIVVLLPVLEGGLRYGQRGGVLVGLAMGVVVGGWTAAVSSMTDTPGPMGWLVLRAGITVILGMAMGSVVRALQDQHTALQFALDASSEAMVTIDPDGRILTANDACGPMFGDDLLGRRLSAVVGAPPAEAAALRANAGPRVMELRLDHRWVECTVTPAGDLGISFVQSRDVTDRIDRATRLTHDATHDQLTELANRRHFVDRLSTALRELDGQPVTVLLMDLDDFKVVNDSLGHQAGDALLQTIAERVRDTVRGSDLPVRLGGDEFAVLMTDPVPSEVAFRLAERLLVMIRQPVSLGAGTAVVDGSIGIARGIAGQTTIDELLHGADVALYAAKSQGRGMIVEYQPGMEAHFLDSPVLSADLRIALEQSGPSGRLSGDHGLSVVYQPIFSLDGAVAGVEALCRWDHPTRGRIGPDQFVPVAERTGLVHDLGSFVRTMALREVGPLVREGRLARLAVNVSGLELTRPGFVSALLHEVAGQRFPLDRLVLEITESTVLDETATIVDDLATLRSMGVRIAFDDFGAGYSSLAALRWLPVDVIKIDRTFIQGATDRRSTDAALIDAVIRLGSSLELEVVAEGVETEEQRLVLADLGCQSAQGFLFARPAPLADLVDLLELHAR